MASNIRRRRRARQIPYDVLEGRLLLSGDRPRGPAAEVRTDAAATSLRVKLNGTEFLQSLPIVNPGPNIQYTSTYNVSAQGHVAKIGPVQFSGSYNLLVTYVDYKPTSAYPISQGTGILSDSRGDQLAATFAGTTHNRRMPHSDKYEVTSSFTGEVTGLTGQYAGMTGSLSGTGRLKGRDGISLALTIHF
jgi:hypothetical protein